MQRKLVTLLTIAGSDCSGGAGIQADIRAAAACNVYSMTAITAVTSQNSHGICNLLPLSPADVKSQLDAISQEIVPDAIKIGMIATPGNASVIAEYIKSLPTDIPVVTDPVLTSSAGGTLSQDLNGMAQALKSLIFPLSAVVTPNLLEAKFFLGCSDVEIRESPAEVVARRLLDIFGCEAVILKGGHASGNVLTDTLVTRSFPDSKFQYSSKRIECKNLHGTGCTYASALAAELAKGNGIEKSFFKTSALLNRIISESCGYDFGASCYGPLNILDYTTV